MAQEEIGCRSVAAAAVRVTCHFLIGISFLDRKCQGLHLEDGEELDLLARSALAEAPRSEPIRPSDRNPNDRNLRRQRALC